MKLQIENIEMAQAITFKSKTIIAYALVTSILSAQDFYM
jgi:hypothetical protein